MAKKKKNPKNPPRVPRPKKAAPKRRTRSAYITKSSIRRLMKNEGANLISEEAILLLLNELEAIAKRITKKAVNLTKGEKRKRITGQDIQDALY